MNKKGLSQVVGTVVLILITVGLIAGIWGFINGFVSDRLDRAGSCSKIIGKIEINNDYTCYNVTSNQTLISVRVRDISADGLLLSIDFDDGNRVFFLENETKVFDNFTMYNGDVNVYMPKAESVRTYILDIAQKPSGIKIAPKVNGVQCDVVVSTNDLPSCL